MQVNGKNYRTVWWENNKLKMINQIPLPHKFEIIEFTDYKKVAEAIKEMNVRGAGAIGAAAGYAMALAAVNEIDLQKAEEEIKATRPTAIDLGHAVEKVLKAAREKGKEGAVEEAQKIANENLEAGKKIGKYGEKLLMDGMKVLTHCNAGWLAFVDWGTALSPIYAAKRKKKKIFVFVDETRPRLQGARLTAWELMNEKIEFKIIAYNAAGYYMQKKEINLCVVGADRIASNGDIANKIGTYEKAVLAKENRIPFYVAAPLSTFDLKVKNGKEIPIEERNENEVLFMQGLNEKNEIEKIRIAPKGSKAGNPAFDITPAKFITGIITEKGIINANEKEIRKLFE
ncbi:MAG: S-methyl-5-thioribose-1-phosphate isomerase [Candidatus Diapherotrites archaeon]